MRRHALSLTILLVGLGCATPDPGVLQMNVVRGDEPPAPGELLSPIQVSRSAYDPDALETPVEITITHSGGGTLGGTTERFILANEAITVFADLTYDRCGSFTVTATADDPLIPPVTSGLISVRPSVALVSAPAQSIVDGTGPIDSVTVELRGRDGSPIDLDGIPLVLTVDGGVTLSAGNTEVTTVGGLATFDGLELSGEGLGQLRVGSGEPTCPISEIEVGTVAVGAFESFAPIDLPSGRVGVPYNAPLGLEDPELLDTGLPDGLAISGDTVQGIPTEIGWHRFEVFRVLGPTIQRRAVRLAVFPNHDPELAEPVDPIAAGSFPVEVAALAVPTVEVSVGTLTDVAVRVAYPGDGAGAFAEGPFPLIVFLPTVADPPALYDLYTELHDHWASHGFVVASVDTSALAIEPESPDALDDQATMLLAAMDALLAESRDPASGYFEALDEEQVYAAGHGRGAGGAIDALRAEPSIAGLIAIAPVVPDLVEALADTEPRFDPLPVRPVLLLLGGADRVVPWPQADLLGSMVRGPLAAVTILGANHLGALDAGTPHVPVSPSTITPAERRAVERRYSTAFLHRFGYGELGFEATLFGERGRTTEASSAGVVVRARRWLDTELRLQLQSGSGEVLVPGSSPYEQPLLDLGVSATQLLLRLPPLSGAAHFMWAGPINFHQISLQSVYLEDVASRRRLVMDVVGDCPPPPADPTLPDDTCPAEMLDFTLALTDVARDSTRLAASEALGEAQIHGRHWTTVAFDLNDFDIDPGRLSQAELIFTSPETGGSLWIRDARFE